ncbi:hypothetical protein C2W59_02639 [Bacillus pumilus]|uniref:Uncharacterized protein n=1 Tax=Bacillus pumilus TaxID=1408 RepID=A0AB34QVZ0_BACPU|nr:hypothetical protein B4127_3725 [Bacillus pumilus]RAP15950.1 hypothetical protein C2W58_01602 [Bacillus pumilus]RAP23793.1 hypothetical protein C2W59_02639 [Bacillus pumilus]
MTTKYHDHDFLKSRENVIIIVENPFIEKGSIHHRILS